MCTGIKILHWHVRVRRCGWCGGENSFFQDRGEKSVHELEHACVVCNVQPVRATGRASDLLSICVASCSASFVCISSIISDGQSLQPSSRNMLLTRLVNYESSPRVDYCWVQVWNHCCQVQAWVQVILTQQQQVQYFICYQVFASLQFTYCCISEMPVTKMFYLTAARSMLPARLEQWTLEQTMHGHEPNGFRLSPSPW